MSNYETALLAYGIPPEQAKRDAWADAMQWFRNRDLPSYGRYEPDPPSTEEVRQAFSFKYGEASVAE